jgi:N-acetylgalactosamine-6-sulfatase
MTMDFSRSIVVAAGAKPPAGRAFDGMDILRAAATNRPVQERTLFWRARRAERTEKAVRDGSLKYISLQNGDDVKEYLFDLEHDPAEKNNLFNEQPENVLKLKTLLERWELEVKHKR